MTSSGWQYLQLLKQILENHVTFRESNLHIQTLQREILKTTGQRHKSEENELDSCMLQETASTNILQKETQGIFKNNAAEFQY